MLVLDDEDHVEARQNGWHEVDVLVALGVVPATKHTVGCRQNGAARVEGGGDASLQQRQAFYFILSKLLQVWNPQDSVALQRQFVI